MISASFKVDPDSELSASLDEKDGQDETVSFVQTSEPSHGRVVAFGDNGAFIYVPDAGFTGTDSFGVSASDGFDMVLATITLNVE